MFLKEGRSSGSLAKVALKIPLEKEETVPILSLNHSDALRETGGEIVSRSLTLPYSKHEEGKF